jgi:hypothetical protein
LVAFQTRQALKAKLTEEGLVNFTIYQEIQERMEDQKRRDEAEEYRKEEHKRRLEQERMEDQERT